MTDDDGSKLEPIEEDPDGYNNLILLCKADHKGVDDQPNAFSPDRLRTMKREHEAWVQCQLSADPRPRMRVFKAPDETNGIDIIVVPTGKILLSIIGRCMEGYYDSDELETDEEVDLVGGFLQEVRDWNDITDEIEVDGRFRAELSLTRSIRALCDAGWVVYAGRLERILDVDGKRSPWPVSVVHVFRLANARPREEPKA